MTPSLPCPKCGHVDDLDAVNPLWNLGNKAILWDCRCGSIRAILINHHTPQELVRKAMEQDERTYKKAG